MTVKNLRISLLILILVLSTVLTACGSSSNQSAESNGGGQQSAAPAQQSAAPAESAAPAAPAATTENKPVPKPANDKSDTEKVVNVFNWSEYLPDTVIKQFEQETGIKVNYDTYSSNEEMMAKLSAGNAGYDISVASTYYVEVLRKSDMLLQIDKTRLPNMKNLGKSFLGLYFDPNNDYSIPYMWGKVVIAYNTKLVGKEITSYRDLYDPMFKNNLVLLDDVRSMVGVTLAMLGYDQNSTDPKQLDEAKAELMKLKSNIKAFDSDSPKTKLISGDVKAGIVWDAEGWLAHDANKDIKVVYPKEGMNLWQDNFVIPKDAPHYTNALKFINFILRPEISAEVSKTYPYGNPNEEALKLLPKEILDKIVVPESELKKGQYNRDVGKATVLYDRIWSELKQ
ncbi:ABC transporter substrate-binding protein [Ferviditalea candida]|uniref:Spermidine/putrescine ABC transporter substrate-binding protein n=1 Tax=Ferviditalea candida TaxID=3108399 RepID=A0ABU5ZEA8_9BACL|nr:spermidine/putrescine ABC transporter substrate-binding protein [Paenibacillaceae bacterium T2]